MSSSNWVTLSLGRTMRPSGKEEARAALPTLEWSRTTALYGIAQDWAVRSVSRILFDASPARILNPGCQSRTSTEYSCDATIAHRDVILDALTANLLPSLVSVRRTIHRRSFWD
jgi:hypothetical protein